MSEAIAGLPPAPGPSVPLESAVVVLFRRAEHGVEVFWLEREQRLAFAGGYFAFPGGRVDAQDRLQGDEASRFMVAALRELFEESGVLLAHGVQTLDSRALEDLRRATLAGSSSFPERLATHGLRLATEQLQAAGRWVTPEFSPRRYDARFFVAELPPSQEASAWKGESAQGAWVTPAAALARWEAGTALLHPPNLFALQVLAGFSTVERAVAKLREPPYCLEFVAQRIELQRGVLLVPLRTATLPPATHTNCYLLGTQDVLVVDPGAEGEQLEPLLRLLRELEHEGRRARAVVLTHHHADHSSGVRTLLEQLGVPLWAHELTAAKLELPVQRLLRDGDLLNLDGPMPMQWRVLHTPGHARGHVTLVDVRSSAAVVGDMVAGVGTIVIDPPEGNMGEYLRQLARLETLPVRTLYPAHGQPIADGPGKLREYAVHRAWREGKVLDACRSFGRPVGLEELVPRAYDDVQAFVWPLAERNTAAIVEKLVEEGRVVRTGDLIELTGDTAR